MLRRRESAAMEDWKLDRIGSAERGENPMVMARMRSGFAVIGDTQFLPGYSVLLAVPRVESLQDLSQEQRARFLLDMSLIGDAVAEACKPVARVNYGIIGNNYRYLLAHIFPRYETEHAEYFTQTPFNYPREKWYAPQFHYSDVQHGAMRARITELLKKAMQASNALPQE
jgi:diadenosine tetraphosphate (Ap4A) HIT family hydrolase